MVKGNGACKSENGCALDQSFVCKMRQKHILIFFIFLLITAVSMWLIFMETPNIQTIVTETHKQISSNLKKMTSHNSKPTRLQLGFSENEMNQVYLELMGFTASPRLYPNSYAKHANLPVIVTGITSRNYESAILLVQSVQKHLRNLTVVMFDLGLGSYELLKLKKQCNSSDVCLLKALDFDKFPGHLKNHMYMQAYLPIILQQALNEFGAIIWVGCDSEEFFLTGNVSGLLSRAEKTGIVAWTRRTHESTSALTHAGMFSYFKMEPSKYYFQHMISTSHLVLYNTERTHHGVMLPWVQCALSYRCISPVGATAYYCREQKPRYRYSGCHHYEASALNIILGQAFGFDEGPYTYDADGVVVFGAEIQTGANDSAATEATTASTTLVKHAI